MRTVGVMVVEDSLVSRELIVSTLNADPRLSVISSVETAEAALRLIPRISPDVICMDIRLPGMSGIEATRHIMQEWPTPIVVVARDLCSETINRSMEALSAGAVSVVEKPSAESAGAYKAMARSLCDQFASMSQLKVVRQRFNRSPQGRTEAPLSRDLALGLRGTEGAIEVVGIAASTGGPAAVARVLHGLGASFAPAVLVVQHMGSEFLKGYADWLDSICEQTVLLARDLERPRVGHVYIAPGDHHLTYQRGRMRLVRAVSARGHVPSGDALLASLADLGRMAAGVVLTGMGDDGARGLLKMRSAGGHTIVQDETTSAVYGMPAAAMALGAAVERLPIGAIAARIMQLDGSGRSRAKLS
jgi:two-component system, chemotaxis family, protein-glutamate methylesterase/glutaminase